ncbi:MAG: outer membrane lipoprotein-sorting protein [Myxococcota bacterium]
MKRICILVGTAILLPRIAMAGPAEDRGLEIASEADRRDTGFNDSTALMTMTLRNKRGQESKRELEVRVLEVEGEGDKSMTLFHNPRDVRGTSLLTFSHGLKPDDQWLYLPALRRVKRIASNNKSGPFMGSEFAYEDMSSQEIEKYKYKYIKDENLDGHECFVVERYPVDSDSGYTKQQVWVDQEEYRVRKVDYYDRKGQLLKTLVASQFSQHLGRYWRANRMVMTNHQTGKSTELTFENYKFRNGLKESDFSRTRLTQLL